MAGDRDTYIEGLEAELAGYEAKGRKDRAAEVRKELKRAKAAGREKPTPEEATREPDETRG